MKEKYDNLNFFKEEQRTNITGAYYVCSDCSNHQSNTVLQYIVRSKKNYTNAKVHKKSEALKSEFIYLIYFRKLGTSNLKQVYCSSEVYLLRG